MSTKPDLETDIHNLVHMAYIAATLVESSIGARKQQEEVNGKPNTYYLNGENADAIEFACYEVHSRLRAFRKKYLSTHFEDEPEENA
jgi:hypothetical protein